MLVEIILASAMLTLVLLSIELYYKKILDVSVDTTRHIQAGFLLEEGIEVMKLLRDDGWTTNIATLTPGTPYHLRWTGTEWATTTSAQLVENIFTRTVVISDVLRDGSDNIAEAGTLDPGTKKVTVSVSWSRKGGTATTTETVETYIANLFTN